MIGILTALIGLIVAGLILVLIRNDRIHTANGLGWILVAVLFSLLGLAPSLFDSLARVLGVSYPPTLAFTLGIVAIVIKMLLDDLNYSRLRVRHQRLVQKVALIEVEVRRLKQKNQANDDSINAVQGERSKP